MDKLATDFDSLQYDNRFVAELPEDHNPLNQRRQVHNALYSRVNPVYVTAPKLLDYSAGVMALLGLNESFSGTAEFAEIMAGNRLVDGMDPYASCYGGHQFGNWAGQLGDGRAINLGEIVNPQGQRWALQLKGAGPTPYSRSADGLAVLRSSVREFLCSEAMHYLGVPTTRALSLVETGEQVMRDMFYDGNARLEPGAVVCRVAPSFTRFGHFQIVSAQQNMPLLKQLIDYTLRTDFGHKGPVDNAAIYAWFTDVCERTALMVAHWMRVGFVHGVMNTDNMSILGLTIDYGPYGWLDNYDPNWTPNTTDVQHKRYRYANQPDVAHWNLLQLAQTLAALTEETEPLQAALQHYAKTYAQHWNGMLKAKLGLSLANDDEALPVAEAILALLSRAETDMTIFFRNMATLQIDARLDDDVLLSPLMEAFYLPDALPEGHLPALAEALRALLKLWEKDGMDQPARVLEMNQVNPLYVLRNYLAQQAIDLAEQGDDSMIQDLQTVLKRPYDEQDGKQAYAQKRPDWARDRAGCSMLSCSS